MAEGGADTGVRRAKLAFLALGSNMGDRLGHLRKGVRHLVRDGRSRLVATSSVFESEPVACSGGPFLNVVIAMQTDLDPWDLLCSAREAERKAGRTGGRGDARPLDVDILFHGETVLEAEDLFVPHPRRYERPFVVAPLLEVCGEVKDPKTGRRICDEARLVEQVQRSVPKRVAGIAWCREVWEGPLGPSDHESLGEEGSRG